MRVLSKPKLVAFWREHPRAEPPLTHWYNAVLAAKWRSFADVRCTFGHADKVGDYVVFNASGYYRVITDIAFATGCVYIKHVFTHPEYDQWKP